MNETEVAFAKWYYSPRGGNVINAYRAESATGRENLTRALLRAGYVLVANNAKVPRYFNDNGWDWQIVIMNNDGDISYDLMVTIPDHRESVMAIVRNGVQLDDRLVRFACMTRMMFDAFLGVTKTETSEAASRVIELSGQFDAETLDVQRLCDASLAREAIVHSLHPTHHATLKLAEVIFDYERTNFHHVHDVIPLADRLVDETLYRIDSSGNVQYRTEVNPQKAAIITKWLKEGNIFGMDQLALPEIDDVIDTINQYIRGELRELPVINADEEE